MAYDEKLAERVRAVMPAELAAVEKRMFGGVAFMVQGNMAVGVTGDALMVRVGQEGHKAALARPHTRPMDFTGKPLRGFIFVDAAGLDTEDELREWVERGVEFALSLPAK